MPYGFNPATAFAAYSNPGLTYTLGTTLTVAAGQGFSGSISIGDPVLCRGTIAAASGGTINLNAGLALSGTGLVVLGSGTLTNNSSTSGISGGMLSAAYQYVGSGGTGNFTQSAGINAISNYLYLGYGAGDSGTYSLGGGSLSASSEYVGASGMGSFTKTGGTNSIGNYLNLGNNAGSNGTYGLSGSGQLSAYYELVGSSGTGKFTQSGGTNNVQYLVVGGNPGSSGAYSLAAGKCRRTPSMLVREASHRRAEPTASPIRSTSVTVRTEATISAAAGSCRQATSTLVTQVRQVLRRPGRDQQRQQFIQFGHELRQRNV